MRKALRGMRGARLEKRVVYPYVLVKDERPNSARLVMGFATENP